MIVELFMLAALGQCHGYGAGYSVSYGYSYAPQYTYAAPVYAAPAYVAPTYVEKVKTQFVPVEYSPYAALAGEYERAERRGEELRETIARLERRIETLQSPTPAPAPVVQQAAPVVQQQPVYQAPTPQQPVYQAPAPAPQQAYMPAPVPQQAPFIPQKAYPVAPAKDYPSTPGKAGLPFSAPVPPIDPLSSAGVPAVLGRCTQCHTGSSAQGGFMLFDDSGQMTQLDPEAWQAVLGEVHSGRMPKGGPRTTPGEFAELQSYVGSLTGQPAYAAASVNPF
jgi:hypothetical protein